MLRWVWLLITEAGLLLAFFLMSPMMPPLAPDFSPSPLCCCCSRSLFKTLRGFAFAFVGLTVDAWHTADARHLCAASFRTKLYDAVFFGPVAPLTTLLALSYDLASYRLLIRSLDDMPAPQRELGEKAAKIIANCEVVLGTGEGELPQTHGTAILTEIDEEKALVLGSRLPENSYMVQLNHKGKEALLRSGVLPGYRTLQLLQGKTSFAMVFNGMQAFGNVLAAYVRLQTGLLVSPIETIGATFSFLVVIHSVSHFVAARCHRPLIVHLRPGKQKEEVIQMCRSTRVTQDQFNMFRFYFSFLAYGFVGLFFTVPPIPRIETYFRSGTPGVHCITDYNLSGVEVIGPLLFTLSAYLYLTINFLPVFWNGIQYLKRMRGDTALGSPRSHDIPLQNDVLDFIERIRGVNVVGRSIGILIISFICSVGTVSGMIIALVTTIAYWDENFSERTPGIVHIWPFIG